MNKKKMIVAVCIICFLLGTGVFIGKNSTAISSKSEESQTVYEVKGCYVIDINNPAEVSGASEYVFVGEVKRKGDTTYENELQGEPIEKGENGKLMAGMPYTYYDVSVIDNMKNELPQDQPITILNTGGARIDGSGYEVIAGDKMLEVGKTYIFLGNKREDGTILIDGTNFNVPMGESAKELRKKKNLEQNDVYKRYQKAIKNQIKRER